MKARGFTLLELVVALGIFSVMAAMAYGGLNATLQARSSLQTDSRTWQELQLAVAIMDRDLRYLVERGIRDENGTVIPALQGRGSWLESTRAGWANPAELGRASLQRVRYQWQPDRLQRLAWPVLDRTAASETQLSELLDHIERFEIRYWANGQWHDQWPLRGEPSVSRLPEAISLVMEHASIGRIERLYQVLISSTKP